MAAGFLVEVLTAGAMQRRKCVPTKPPAFQNISNSSQELPKGINHFFSTIFPNEPVSGMSVKIFAQLCEDLTA